MITATFHFPDLAARLKAARLRIGQEMIVAMQTNRGMLFDNEGRYNGHEAWDGLVLRSGQVLARRGTLKQSLAPGGGTGQAGPGGIAKMSDDGLVTIGSSLGYAPLMNWGTTKMPDGIMRPVHAKALRIPVPGGMQASDRAKTLRTGTARDDAGNKYGVGGPRTAKIKNADTGKTEHFIFRKWVKIPARRFDTITPQDQAEFAAALKSVITDVLNG